MVVNGKGDSVVGDESTDAGGTDGAGECSVGVVGVVDGGCVGGAPDVGVSCTADGGVNSAAGDGDVNGAANGGGVDGAADNDGVVGKGAGACGIGGAGDCFVGLVGVASGGGVRNAADIGVPYASEGGMTAVMMAPPAPPTV